MLVTGYIPTPHIRRIAASLKCIILAYAFTGFSKTIYAQQDSSWNKKLSKAGAVVSKYSGATDSAIAAINNVTSKPISKTTTKIDSFSGNIQNTVSKYNIKTDSVVNAIQQIPARYIKQVDNKIEKFSDRLTGKTEKTLQKLAKWENKIQNILLKTSPQTAEKLFGPNQMTFSVLLQKIKEGKEVIGSYKAQYDEYTDKLTTNLKYLQSQKDKLTDECAKRITEVTTKANTLSNKLATTEAIEAFIKERKKQLTNEAVKYLGRSKYLTKIDKESYYYVETVRNYKEIFSDPKKTEKIAATVLNKIPAFKKFFSQNSMLASLFGNTIQSGDAQNLQGLQTRASVNAAIQTKLTIGGPNAKEVLSQNLQQAQAELNKLKAKIFKAGGGGGSQELPDFKPNTQKAKTFFQRLEYGFNYQFGKNNSLMPATADIGLSIGYKLNDKSIIGIGAAYKMGLGTIEKIHFSNQGLGLRSFIDWKLKKQFFISGGLEMNHNTGFEKISALKNYNTWQNAGLLGVSKKISMKTRFTKTTKLQLLYDFLYKQHIPQSQKFVFRIGYNF